MKPKFFDAVTRINYWYSWLGAISLMGIVLVILTDVFLRRMFHMTFVGALESVELLLIMVMFAGQAHTEINDRHVQIDILTSKISSRSQSMLRVFIGAISIGISCILVWQSFVMAHTLQMAGDRTGMLGLPVFPMIYLMAIGLSLFCLTLMIEYYADIRDLLARGKGYWGFLSLSVAIVVALFLFPWWGRSLWPDISQSTIGALFLGSLFIFLFLRMHIGLAIAFCAVIGMSFLISYTAGFSLAGITLKSVATSYTWSVIPLFVFMGYLTSNTGMAREIYETAYAWLGYRRGGLAIATMGACGGFAAVTGDTLSGAVTMGSISLPEMKRYKYDPKLATGAVCAGGTLGVLIPPSIGFIIYGLLTEESIGRLFIAGIVPGIVLVVLFALTISVMVRLNPAMGPRGERISFWGKISSLKKTWGVLLLFGVVIGGIYGGVFTATEAGVVGAAGALLLGLIKRTLTWDKFKNSLNETIQTTSMVFLIFIPATILNHFLAATKLPMMMANFLTNLQTAPMVIIIIILVFYIIIGCVMNVLPAVILTLPLIFPTVKALGFDPTWFGVVMMVIMEMGQITPPIGMNVFAISGVARYVPMVDIFKGIIPFWLAMTVFVGLLMVFPQIATFLPDLVIK